MNFPPIRELIWNDEIENLLKVKQFQCVKFSWLHNHESDKYNYYHNLLFIIVAVITSISGTSIVTSNGFFKVFDSDIISIINICFGGIVILSTGFTSFQHMTNYPEVSSQHKIASAKYASLGNNMLKLLALDKESKKTSLDFFTWADAEFTNLQINSPNISRHTEKVYLKENGDFHKKTPEYTLKIHNKITGEIKYTSEYSDDKISVLLCAGGKKNINANKNDDIIKDYLKNESDNNEARHASEIRNNNKPVVIQMVPFANGNPLSINVNNVNNGSNDIDNIEIDDIDVEIEDPHAKSKKSIKEFEIERWAAGN